MSGRGPFEHADDCPDQAEGKLTDECTCGQWEAVQRLLGAIERTPAEDERAAAIEAYSEHLKTLQGYDGHERTLLLIGYATGWDAAVTRAEAAEQALRKLVELKDGPRDADYERRKPLAWEAARRALDGTP